jgi:hypothetical protein
MFFSTFPALKRWAKFGRPSGAGFLWFFTRSNHKATFVTDSASAGRALTPNLIAVRERPRHTNLQRNIPMLLRRVLVALGLQHL